VKQASRLDKVTNVVSLALFFFINQSLIACSLSDYGDGGIPRMETQQGTLSTTGSIQPLKHPPKKRKSLQKVQNIARMKIDYKRRR